MLLTEEERAQLSKMLKSRAPKSWRMPVVSDRQAVGMLYDGLAYGNWPWTSNKVDDILKEGSNVLD